MGAYTPKSTDHLAMSSTVAELDVSSAEARVASAPGSRDLRRTLRRVGSRRFAFFGLAFLIVIGAGWYGHQWWTVGRFIESTDDAYIGGDVTVIAPKVAGFIADVAVTDNQAVHAGDLLARLDDRDYRAALAKTAAAVAERQATLANLDATRRLQEAMVAQVKAEVAAADAEVGHAQAQAAGAQGVAGRDPAQLNLSYTELRAAIDGTIGNRSARNGAFAPVGAQLMSVVPASGLWVDANFKESQLAHMRPGMEATIAADVLPGSEFRGHVASLAPATGAQFSV